MNEYFLSGIPLISSKTLLEYQVMCMILIFLGGTIKMVVSRRMRFIVIFCIMTVGIISAITAYIMYKYVKPNNESGKTYFLIIRLTSLLFIITNSSMLTEGMIR